MSLFDFLFPKRCIQCKKIGSFLCPNCLSFISFLDGMVCVLCQLPSANGLTHKTCSTPYTIDGVFPSLVYKGIVKKIVYTFKYPPHITSMQHMITELFYEGIIQKEQFYTLLSRETILIPIPLHRHKLRKRGYNQAMLLAKGLEKHLHFVAIDCLDRIKETKTQVGLTKEQRQKNITSAFRLKSKYASMMQNQKQVFLIDDVVTSGSTLIEAARVLKLAGVKYVWGVTLAHGE